MCDLIEKVKQIRSITEGLGGGDDDHQEKVCSPSHLHTLKFFPEVGRSLQGLRQH